MTPSVLQIGDPLRIPSLNIMCIHPSEQFLSSTISIDILPEKPSEETRLDGSGSALRLIERLTISVIRNNNKWAIQGSNQGHPACKAGALPLS